MVLNPETGGEILPGLPGPYQASLGLHHKRRVAQRAVCHRSAWHVLCVAVSRSVVPGVAQCGFASPSRLVPPYAADGSVSLRRYPHCTASFSSQELRGRPRDLGHVLDEEQVYVYGAGRWTLCCLCVVLAATSHPDKIAVGFTLWLSFARKESRQV